MITSPSAAEASARLRAIQQDWWRAIEGKDFRLATQLADRILEAAVALRRASYIALDNFMEEHANSTAPGIGSNDPIVPPEKRD